ncbi:hypothetical protein BKA69DRAFT_1129130 [Paraphysoderma sedebokerense]|nr:hypothetical protein BKA69DRAFT_1129130 [Paraphysoderma sedebokerense]
MTAGHDNSDAALLGTLEPKYNENTPFLPVSIETLQAITDEKNNALLEKLGGTGGLAEKLKSNLDKGLNADESFDAGRDLESGVKGKKRKGVSGTGHALLPDGHDMHGRFTERMAVYGTNFIPPTPPPTFISLCIAALKDPTLIILSIAAIVSTAVGVFQYFTPDGDKTVWIEGVAILATVFIVVLVNATNDYRKAQQFRFLSAQKHLTSMVTVQRYTNDTEPAHTTIPLIHLLVGDVVHLATGDIIPADGILISGYNVKTDESSVTGESDVVSKKFGKDIYMISGSKLVDGVASMLVTTVGRYSLSGRSIISLRGEDDPDKNEEDGLTPLQKKLAHLATNIAKFGFTAAVVLVVISIIKFLARNIPAGWKDAEGKPRTTDWIVLRIIDIFITGITVIVVSVPEGLPMAVTIALGYATIRMLQDNNLVRVLSACETMGGATTICSDKTGTLTQNKMTIVAGVMFDSITWKTTEEGKDKLRALHDKTGEPGLVKDFTLACNLNSTAYEGRDEEGKKVFEGSKTECALLEFTALLRTNYSIDRETHTTAHIIPFSSDRKRMSTIIDKKGDMANFTFGPSVANGDETVPSGNTLETRMYVKGASELILESCKWYLTEQGTIEWLTSDKRASLEKTILSFAENALRTIGIAYKDLPRAIVNPDMPATTDMSSLIWMGVVGIEDPLRPEVPPAIKNCQKAGIIVRMVTGDNPVTAKKIARNCGILNEDGTGGLVMEGIRFRALSDAEMKRIIPELRVLARSSPLDKRILVKQLKELGETVAVTGDGTNDGPALKAADVGFAMGIAGTEVAKEASDIILMDDNFASLTKAVMWGRSVYDSVRKFLQFQLTVNVTAVTLAIVSAIADEESESVIKAVQLLWVNLIMDSLAALALATDPPTMELLNRKPHKKSDPLVNYDMMKMIFGQSIFQVPVTAILNFLGPQLFSLDTRYPDPNIRDKKISAIVFNTFVFMQMFNMFNGRVVNKDLNVFHRITYNKLFIVIWVLIVVVQVLIIQFFGVVFKVVPLTADEWGITMALGIISLPAGVLIKLVPDFFRKPEVEPTKKLESIESSPPTSPLSDDGERRGRTQDRDNGEGIGLTDVKLSKSREREMWNRAIRDVRSQVRVVNIWSGLVRREVKGVVVLD